MEYKQFVVRAFEREPGKWRASVFRTSGKAIWAVRGRTKLPKFVTGIDSNTADGAMLLALAAIDAGTFDARRGLNGL